MTAAELAAARRLQSLRPSRLVGKLLDHIASQEIDRKWYYREGYLLGRDEASRAIAPELEELHGRLAAQRDRIEALLHRPADADAA